MTRRTAPVELPNIHPVDELAAVREEIKILEKRADELRDVLIADTTKLIGDQYVAFINSQTRETLDKAAIIDAFGLDAVAPFIKKSTYSVVKLKEKKT